MVDIATGQIEETSPKEKGKNRAAVVLGRLGGLKGGVIRAAKLTMKQKSTIAWKARAARWTKD
jgi:hypothetical protein